MIEAVIFDFDGVLADTEPVYLEYKKEFLKNRGAELPEFELKKFAGRRFEQAIADMEAYFTPKIRRKLIEEFKGTTDMDYGSLLFPETRQTLAALKRMGFKTAVASNTPQKRLNEAIRQCGLEDVLNLWISSSVTGRLKPEPDVYLRAMQELDTKPDCCIAVGDSDCGLTAAKKSGCHVVCRKDERFGFLQELGEYKIKDLTGIFDCIKCLNEIRKVSGT